TLLPVAGALAAAHAKQIVHRDLKPENVILASHETGGLVPKIVDFGIAKLREEDNDGRLTKLGSALGSPDYMSPEQARGKADVDARSDVWALTVVLYECIAGKPPFSGQNYNALLTSIIEDPPPPLGEAEGCDDDLWQFLQRGLAKPRDERWPDVRSLGKALAEWALARDVDTDIAGGSLVAHWLDEVKRPLSDPPPRASGQFQRQSSPSSRRLSVPGLPAAWSATGERPAPDSGSAPKPAAQDPPAASPPAPPRSRLGLAGVAAVVLLAAGGGLFVARGRLLGAHGNAAHAAPAPPPTAAPPAAPSVAVTSAAPAGPRTAAASAPTAAPVATAAPSAAPAASAPSAPADWDACVTSQFAPHAFPGATTID